MQANIVRIKVSDIDVVFLAGRKRKRGMQLVSRPLRVVSENLGASETKQRLQATIEPIQDNS